MLSKKLPDELLTELIDHQKEFVKLQRLTEILSADVEYFSSLLFKDTTTDIQKRAYVRAVFAFLEGTVFGYKRMVLRLSQYGKGSFSEAEIALLKEQSYDLTDQGKAVVQQKFLRFDRNLRFTFDACVRAYGVQHSLDVGGVGWDAMMKAFKLRNRITHPKNDADLSITEDELMTVMNAFSWVLNNLTPIAAGIYADVVKEYSTNSES